MAAAKALPVPINVITTSEAGLFRSCELEIGNLILEIGNWKFGFYDDSSTAC